MFGTIYRLLKQLKYGLASLAGPEELDRRISVGDHTYGVSNQTVFLVKKSDSVDIGKYCSFAPGVRIFPSGEHNFKMVSTFPFYANIAGRGVERDTYSKGKIVIGNDVWVGANVLILSGVTVGDGAVLAAGSVIVKDVEPYSIASGVPAKTLQYRFPSDIIRDLLEIRWWDWDTDKVRERLEDFYLDVPEFIRKYKNEE